MKKDLYQEVTNRIVSILEAGTLPWVRGWSGYSQSPLACNATTNRAYSGINALLALLALGNGWEQPRYLTYRQAAALGGHVKKGEHGTPLYFYKKLVVKDRKDPTGQKDVAIPLLREYWVFNVAQCEGLPEKVVFGEKRPANLNKDAREELADAFIKATGADFREGEGRPQYIPSRDYVTVPKFEHFHSQPEFYSVVFHELIHWTGHKDRLDRQLRTRFGTDEYAMEELIAELGSAFLCAEFGFDNLDGNHAAYLKSWLDCLKRDPKAIFTVANRAQAAVNYLRGLATQDDTQEAEAA